MAVFLLVPDAAEGPLEETEARLRRFVPSLRKLGSIEQIVAEIGGQSDQKSVVLFVSPAVSKWSVDNLIQVARKYRDRVFFILISNDLSASDYKRLVSTGGADWASISGSLQEIPGLISAQVDSRTAAEPSPTGAKATIVSFLPCLGGVGNTSIALEVALGMRRHKVAKIWKICYLDLDFQTSHVCDFLDTDPRLQITEIIDRPERLDDQLFELFTNHHTSGLDVFAAPRSKIDPCEIGIVPLDALFDRIASRYDFVVVDLPVPWFVWTAPTLAHSDAIVITAINSVPCLRQLRANVAALADLTPKPQTAIAINRAQAGLFGRLKGQQRVDRVAADQKVFFVREDPQATDRVNTGTPASLGGPARNRKDFVPLVEFCTAAKRGLVSRSR